MKLTKKTAATYKDLNWQLLPVNGQLEAGGTSLNALSRIITKSYRPKKHC